MKLFSYNSWLQSQSQKDGIQLENQVKLYKEVYDFSQKLETLLQNGNHPTFNYYFQKALSIFHRFAHSVSLKKFNRHIYMLASLYLSAKDNDMFDHTIEIDRYVKCFIVHCKSKEGDDLQSVLIEKIVDAESHILQMIGYDLNIIVPQVYFVEAKLKITVQHGELSKLHEAAQNCLNDLFFTNACLYYEPKILVLCSLQLASDDLKMTISDLDSGDPWYTIFSSNPDKQQQDYEDMQELLKYYEKCLQFLQI
ncbi:unnamed protein product (macronuclear) [Paramecium tetraurelia]|uniref:Uncharacterized protein n=1 Tax=Paramecium tetraurelia TaxID=5888 RepID=A0CID6_PARTE|nr:uncharacterized protein GSPATT00007688001 [Paramecium tetraurelia]CAK70553.1 unnamed protein product [Paramecium tetraurelia]|eukprot:XP_001437950.1 hypothetical protein (macronuclear) [Paramecium tetraurelia strain d4-2]